MLAAVATVLPLLPSTLSPVPSPPASLQHGFYLLYNCDFSCAHILTGVALFYSPRFVCAENNLPLLSS